MTTRAEFLTKKNRDLDLIRITFPRYADSSRTRSDYREEVYFNHDENVNWLDIRDMRDKVHYFRIARRIASAYALSGGGRRDTRITITYVFVILRHSALEKSYRYLRNNFSAFTATACAQVGTTNIFRLYACPDEAARFLRRFIN